MPRLDRIRATTGAAVLSVTFAVVCSLMVEASDATGRSVAVADARVTQGALLDLARGSILIGDDALTRSDYVALLPSTIRINGREIDLAAFEIIDANDLLSLGDPPVMESGASHVCALEDGVTWVTADGGCKDLLTGLVWSTDNMGSPCGSCSYSLTQQFVADSTESDFDDWRLPTRAEIETVAAHGAATHFAWLSCEGSGFKARWSSTTRGQRAWIVSPCDGESRLVWAGGPAESYLRFVGVREATVTPVCGDGNCDPGETPCNCPADCGTPPPTESDCANGADDDCDGLVDCDDGDCAGSPACTSACNDNGVCDPGEDCDTCPNDCDSKTNGPPSGRYCCGNGILEGPEGDGRCDGNH